MKERTKEELEQVPGPGAPMPVLPEAPPDDTLVVPGARLQALTPRQIAWRRFKRHRPAMVSMVVLGILALVTILAPFLPLQNPQKLDLIGSLQGPGAHHWFGTDNLGRDEFARVIWGGRISLLVGVTVALFSGIIGTAIGSIAGFYGKWVDQLLMRVTDLFLAIPFLVVAILGTTIIARSFPHLNTKYQANLFHNDLS